MAKVSVSALSLLILISLCGCHTEKGNPASVQPSAQSVGHTAKQSISQKLKEHDHLPVEERIALYHRLKKEEPNGYNFENEDELTMYGYSLLWAERYEEAVAIFKLIVEQFPDSSNPYDSLGEGYMMNGDTTLAIANYKRSLELNPDNFNAEDQIERMRYPDRVPETPAEKFVKVYTAQEYRDDLDQLGKKLIEVHPNALKFITKENFWKTIEEKKALITGQTTYSEFAWHCSEIIASVNCSHTSMGSFYPESAMLPAALRFPLQTRWVDDKLFVIDPLNNADQVAIKDEILTINGIPAQDLVRDIYQHIPSQGYIETTKKHFFNTWATGLIPYALGFPDTYTIRVRGKNDPVILHKAASFKEPLNDPSIKYCGDNLCFEVLGSSKNAVLTISSFNYYPWNDLNIFVDFIDNSFKEIQEKSIKNLIIDLRFNGGGSPESAIHLLKYLTDQPFTYFSNTEYYQGTGRQLPHEQPFKGKCYFIIDGHGNSTTGHFMAIVKYLKLGVIVGEELGSNHFCTAGQAICRLANTKLEYYVANATSAVAVTALPDETGILPDHEVTQSIDDYLNKVDAVKEYTLKLIEK